MFYGTLLCVLLLSFVHSQILFKRLRGAIRVFFRQTFFCKERLRLPSERRQSFVLAFLVFVRLKKGRAFIRPLCSRALGLWLGAVVRSVLLAVGLGRCKLFSLVRGRLLLAVAFFQRLFCCSLLTTFLSACERYVSFFDSPCFAFADEALQFAFTEIAPFIA